MAVGKGGGRYAFQGMEQDDEIYGSGNLYTAMFWEYDPRLGRRWNVDPVTIPWESPYAAFHGSPILFTDPLGLSAGGPDRGDASKLPGPPSGGGGKNPGKSDGSTHPDGDETKESSKDPDINITSPDVPLTTKVLRKVAETRTNLGTANYGRTGSPKFNREVGTAFQRAQLNNIGLAENYTSFPSSARANATNGTGRIQFNVRPDAIYWHQETKSECKKGGEPVLSYTYEGAVFIEVKAVQEDIHLSTSNFQILGLLDAVSRTGGSKAPVLWLVTTHGTKIGEDVIAEATARGVALYQSESWIEDNRPLWSDPYIADEAFYGDVHVGLPVMLNLTLKPPTTLPRNLGLSIRYSPMVPRGMSIGEILGSSSDPDPPTLGQ